MNSTDDQLRIKLEELVGRFDELAGRFEGLVDLVRQGFESMNAEIREDRAMTTALTRDVHLLKNEFERVETVLGRGMSDNLLVKVGILESNVKDLRDSVKFFQKIAWGGLSSAVIGLATALYAAAQPHIFPAPPEQPQQQHHAPTKGP